MRYYLDTEFNGFGGELMSLALVPEDPTLPCFYRVVEWRAPLDAWVKQHVVPFLGEAPVPRARAALDLSFFLAETSGPIAIVADWPTDFEHLLALLITGPGQMVPSPDFDMEYRRLAGFNTASASRLPHNALADAEALRDYCEALGA
ncbi:hypothetical protein D7X74_30455 [Corallococcus sp. CA047B]|uniref:hypothetical protein n=1 Tax=Corallococcus sp. CA047B TaxID=2316729 RepID=UPI000EA3E5B8|nr:hypothetical protein [Corallococcus sp. CA047B]RKH09006.1 hypothetical protein D7X74_30455 [Corallococcus sp. CA047B]